jgi:signal transduction histidine kinase
MPSQPDTAPPGDPLPPPWTGRIIAREPFLEAVRGLDRSNPPLARAVARAALGQAQEQGDRVGQVYALLALGAMEKASCIDGHIATYEQAFRLASAMADADDAMRMRVLTSRLALLADAGSYAEALDIGRQAIEIALAQGRGDVLNRVCRISANVMDLIGEHEMALAMLDDVRMATDPGARAVLADIANNEAATCVNFARALRADARLAEASAVLARGRQRGEEALSAELAVCDEHAQLASFDTLMSVLLEQGDWDAAARTVRTFRAACVSVGEPGARAWGCFEMNRVALALASGGIDAKDAVVVLEQVARIDDPLFACGEWRFRLLALLSRAHEAHGGHAAALRYHKQWAKLELAARSSAARERAKALQRQQLALRGEAVEFIAHDLRTPLALAIHYLEMASADLSAPTAAQHIKHATHAARRTMDIAEQALGLMRAEQMHSGELTLLDLSALVDDVCEQMAPPPGSGIAVERRIEEGHAVRGDRSLLSRALCNLIDNAMRHSSPGKTVEVALTWRASRIALSVTDHGPGIDAAVRRQLFARYAGERAGRGHGLGLALVARVARLHDARIDVTSPDCGGTRICIGFNAAPSVTGSPPSPKPRS